MLNLIGELERLNQRYETVKNNPNWDEAMLQILITAQYDLATLLDSPVSKNLPWSD